jgi:hypothetical protein
MKNVFMFVAAFVSMTAAQAQLKYSLANKNATGVTFQIAYSLGVHDGTVSEMDSSVQLSDKNKILSGEFTVPLSAMATGNATRDCHMREALGIKYEGSAFPTDHVCVGDQLPATGPNAMAFENLQFKFKNVKAAASELPEVLEVGKSYPILIQGQWTLHGVTVDVGTDESIAVQVKLLDGATGELQLFGKFELSLAKFGVVVKPFKIAFVKIGVADNAKVTINTRLLPTK